MSLVESFRIEFTRDLPSQLNSITIDRPWRAWTLALVLQKVCLFDKDVPSRVCFTLEIKRICCEAATHTT